MNSKNTPPFHLAFPVRDIEETRHFYIDVLGCKKGRETEKWIDFDFYGHQISAHVCPAEEKIATNEVDNHAVPVRHFGAILEWSDWEALAERLKKNKTEFIIEPYIRFKGLVGEQGTFFFKDPSGNALEFKTFRDPKMIYAE